VEMDKIREMVREWKAEAARHGRPLKLPTSESFPDLRTRLIISAIHAAKHLDCRTGSIWSDHGVYFLHYESLAGEASSRSLSLWE